MTESSPSAPGWPGPSPLRCLVTGASGYIGGRLVPELLAAGYAVRCMARDPGKLSDRPWSGGVEVAAADALEGTRVRCALEGVDVAYYLIHSLGTGASFEQRDRDAAGIFADAAVSAGVKRIVYLGGIVSGDGGGLSPHLRSRAEVGDILLGGDVPVVALQAAVIIGSGSASFEMLRYLTERLPVMVTPKWVETRIQPIAVHDVLRYLVGCAALPPDINRRFDIGGPDVLTYAEMMRRYSGVAGLRPRVLIPVPLLTPRLSSLWVGLVTPVPAGLAMPLVESLRNEVVCSEHDIAAYVPDPQGALCLSTVPLRWPCSTPARARSPPAGHRPRRPALPATRFPATRRGRAARSMWTRASVPSALRRRHCGGSSRASEVRRDGIPSRPHGPYAGCSTGSPAASGCAAAGVIRGTCSSATRWISGG